MTTPRETALTPAPRRSLSDEVSLPSPRVLLQPVRRYRRLAATIVAAGVLLALVAAELAPPTFDAEMTLLVRRDRVDGVLSPAAQPVVAGTREVHEADIYGEIELLGSRELLEQVALSQGLVRRETPDQSAARDAAVETLRGSLSITPVRRTTMIRVAYRNADRTRALGVLDDLSARYLQKHLTLHRPTGTQAFFAEQAAQRADALREAEQRLQAFTARVGVVSADREKTGVLEQAAQFEAAGRQARASLADADRRLATLEASLAATPERLVTRRSDAGNVELVRTLRAQLVQLDLKRADLAARFTATYPPLVQVEQDLASLRQSLAEADAAPLVEETTDQNPTHQWLRGEAARVRAERQALTARASALQASAARYHQEASALSAVELEQQTLLRAVEEAREQHALYRRRQEEARISDALDQARLANVTLAERPHAPSQPSSRKPLILAGGGVVALVLAAAAALARHLRDPRFRSPDEVLAVLDVPVLAALPPARD